MSAPLQLVVLARKAASAQSLDGALVCAVVEQESGWNPWAMRYEPAFFAKYVAALYSDRSRGLRTRIFLGLDAGDGASGARDRLRWSVFVGAMRPRAKFGAGVQGAAQEIRCSWRGLCAGAAGLEWRVERGLSHAGAGAAAALFVMDFCPAWVVLSVYIMCSFT